MIVYFADRQLNIIGQASTALPNGLTITYDRKTEDVETGVAVFECKIPFDKDTRLMVEECTEVGNYILRSHDSENEFYQIIDAEIDTKKQEVYIYAEDDGMDLLNEVVGAYEADKAYPISHYINKYASGAGFVIGINEVPDLTRKLGWDGESTASARIASVATQFGGCEVSYSFDIEGLSITKKYINIYKERGKDTGVQLRLNKEVDRIITKKSIANLATALQCTGGTPEDDNYDDDVEPVAITLEGYAYDDGDFYVDGAILKSRKALDKWCRLLSSGVSGGHIVKQYSYDTLSQQTLCSRAITELKKICDMEVNFEVDITELDAKIGDRIIIIDDAGELYLSARILQLETSVVDQEKKATLGEHLMKGSGISQKVADLAAQFSKATVSVARARAIADTAKQRADAAQAQADAALSDAENAQKTADEATAAANTAAESAQKAQQAADKAQAAVDIVESNVESLEITVANAKQAAENAEVAAREANAKSDEAATAAAEAKAQAADANAQSEIAERNSASAVEKAEAAQTVAGTATTTANDAKSTAEAAKIDAKKAEEEVASLGERLTTVSNTMEADFARKTDLTETEASLTSKIEQNAAQISSTVSRMETIDETANNAAEQAAAAQNLADQAQEKADAADADAKAAQTAADNAAQAAANAQSEADKAKQAAASAREIADKADADLAAAQADLTTVSSRVDATEADILAAQQAVETAQAAADKAKADASAADKKAADAQGTADKAVSDAEAAQSTANSAVAKADAAKLAADAAQGDATAAIAKAEEAQQTAVNAQNDANTAKANAEAAQAAADTAATNAANAQKAADDADAKAAAAQSDLNEAKQNLADVTSRVGATEEEVEAAKKAVETAQGAADKAQEEAEAAQAAADKAKTDAATAQTKADNAKTAADNAQAAADAAQEAADDAQAAVDALAVRVTTAETKITQNSEQIALMATRDEVEETIGGHYSKEETEALIQIEADSIKSSVSSNYVEKSGYEDFKATLKTELEVWAAGISGRVTATEENVASVDSDLQEKFNTITKYFTFDINGLTIGQVDNPNKVVIDNDQISILVNNVPVQEFKADGSALIPVLRVTQMLNVLGLQITEEQITEDSSNINIDYVGV